MGSNMSMILQNFKSLESMFLVSVVVQLGVREIRVYLNSSVLKDKIGWSTKD
jgi:hypothetical protein